MGRLPPENPRSHGGAFAGTALRPIIRVAEERCDLHLQARLSDDNGARNGPNRLLRAFCFSGSGSDAVSG
jgi:hypothetical protein